MPLAPGTRLGVYEITSPIGEGGMGQVFRARDTKLNRDVALKVLPDSFANDPDRMSRFTREAQTLAALNHPNIAHIHGLEESSGVRALVMEHVEGEDLSQRIARGAMPLDEALPIARQIAEALEAAHDQGIVHRDLKPANIKVRPDGTVKVLDFGLAKSMEPAGSASGLSHSPTVNSPVLTAAGVVLGTAAYMSPEQARGKAVDKRTDIWAFGCVMYEMLTGRRAFPGDTVSDTIAAILEREPNWGALPPRTLPFASIVRRCLEKDVKRRLRDIGDVKQWLEETAAHPSDNTALPAMRSRRALWIAAAAVFGVVVGGGTAGLLMRSRGQMVPPRVGRFELTSSRAGEFTVERFGANVAISPDGSRIVYTATRNGVVGLVMRKLVLLEGDSIAESEGGGQPFFSPDGQHIGFATLYALKRVPVEGGPSVTICEVSAGFRGATWGPDNTIVFAQDGGVGLLRVSASGGAPEKLVAPDTTLGEENYVQPTLLPGGHAVLYTVLSRGGQTRIVARRLGGAAVTVAEGGAGPRYLPSGYVAFGQGDRLMAVRFDPDTLHAIGSPVPVQDNAFTKIADGVSNIASADDGTAVFVAGQNVDTLRRLVWVDRLGKRVAPAIEQPLYGARNVRLSPDGRRVALTVGTSGHADIWVYDLGGAAQPLKLTFQDHNTFPIWSPDGKRIFFLSVATSGARMFSIAADGSVLKPERVTTGDSVELPLSWSPDGAFLLFADQVHLWLLQQGERTARPWLQTPFTESGGRFSSNGRWVAYVSNQTGSLEVWVRPFPGPGAPVRVSSDGGYEPVWSHDGKELFYRNGPKVLSTKVVAEATDFRTDAPRVLVEGGFVYDDADQNIRGLWIQLVPFVRSGVGGLADALQSVEAATNEIILLSLAVLFLVSLETRVKRRAALRMLHRLRSTAHVVDMHQLTKDPDWVVQSTPPTEASPDRTLTRVQLGRYLDYCSELLALVSKLAAVLAQHQQDPVVLSAVNEIELLTSSLSRKIWQKITILEIASTSRD